MATAGGAARTQAKGHLQSALETGVRGEPREAIKQALKIAEGRRVTTLTDLEYRQLAIGGKLVDPDRPGLLMRHGKRTGKIWIFRFDHPETGKQTELQFGRYPEMGLADAREAWSRLRDQRREGRTPLVGADELDAAGPQAALGELCRRYVHEYARKVKRSWAEDERLLTRHILPHYTDLPVAEFDHEKVASILHGIHERGAPREAEKLRACLQTLFNVATGRTRKISTLGGTWLPPDFVNPVSSVMLPRRAPKSHKPSRAELRSYVQGLGDLGEVGEVLRVQIETMSRIGEVTGMRWNELDLDGGTWTLPAARSKNGKAHTVMLARQTLERLRARQQTNSSEFVFPAPRAAGKTLSPPTRCSTCSPPTGASWASPTPSRHTASATRR